MSRPPKIGTNRRDEIVREAARLFKEKGFGASGMRELADRVGMEAASLYNHIQSKDDLLEAVCEGVAGVYLSHLSEIENETDVLRGIECLLRLHIRFVITDPESVFVANNEWKHLKTPGLDRFKEARQVYENRFSLLIEKGVEEGKFRPVNGTVALYTMLSALRWIEFWIKPGRSVTTLENDIVSLLLNGLKQ